MRRGVRRGLNNGWKFPNIRIRKTKKGQQRTLPRTANKVNGRPGEGGVTERACFKKLGCSSGSNVAETRKLPDVLIGEKSKAWNQA